MKSMINDMQNRNGVLVNGMRFLERDVSIIESGHLSLDIVTAYLRGHRGQTDIEGVYILDALTHTDFYNIFLLPEVERNLNALNMIEKYKVGKAVTHNLDLILNNRLPGQVLG